MKTWKDNSSKTKKGLLQKSRQEIMGDWTRVEAMGKKKIHEYETCLGGKINVT